MLSATIGAICDILGISGPKGILQTNINLLCGFWHEALFLTGISTTEMHNSKCVWVKILLKS